MGTGTVKAVTGRREWSGKYGPMIDYELTFEADGKSGAVYLTKKPDSPAPEVGESFDFEVVKRDQYGTKIKRVFEDGAKFAGPTTAASPSQAARSESIERQVAAKCAAQVAAAQVATGKLPTVAALVDEFHEAIRGYTTEKYETPGDTNIAAESLPAADTTGLKSDDDEIPF